MKLGGAAAAGVAALLVLAAGGPVGSALGAQRRPARPARPAPAPTPAGASDARLRGGRDELARVRQERGALETRLRALQATAHDLRDEVANLDRQADATARLVAALDRQLAAIAVEERDAAARLQRATDDLARQQVGLRRRLVDIWKRGPLFEAEALLSAASFDDLVARYKYLHELARRDRFLVRRVERLRNEVAGQRALLVRLQVELARNRGDRAAEEVRLRAFGERRGASLATVEQQEAGARRRLAEVARAEARLEGLIASLEAARRREEAREAERRAAASRAADARAVAAAAARVAARGRRGAAPAPNVAAAPTSSAPAPSPAGEPAGVTMAGSPLAVGQVAWPVRGGLVYRFGRVVGANNTTTRWNGVGIAAAAGSPVRAAAAGRVVLAQTIGTYGLTVIVRHGGGDYSVYGSLQRADVRVGDDVARGQTLGAVGAADPDLPAHVHFELRPAGRAVDPLPYLR